MDNKEIDAEIISIVNNNRPIELTTEIISQLEVGDKIYSGHEEEHEYSDSATPSYFYFKVIRKRFETNAEYAKRKSEFDEFKIESKKRRKETYLKLKKEFENESAS